MGFEYRHKDFSQHQKVCFRLRQDSFQSRSDKDLIEKRHMADSTATTTGFNSHIFKRIGRARCSALVSEKNAHHSEAAALAFSDPFQISS